MPWDVNKEMLPGFPLSREWQEKRGNDREECVEWQRECAKWQHYCHPRKHTHCHPRNLLSRIHIICHHRPDQGSIVTVILENHTIVIPNLIGDPVFSFFFFVIFIFCNSWNLQTWIYVIFLSNIKRKKYFLDSRNRSEWQIGLGNDKDRECLEWQRGVCGMTVLTFRFFVYRCNWFKNYLLTN